MASAKLPQMNLNELCQRNGWQVRYDDLQPESHWAPIHTLSFDEQRDHPLFKTIRCTAAEQSWHRSGGCPKGDACVFAHSDEELCELPADRQTQRFRFRLIVTTQDRTLEYENDREYPSLREAKGALSQHCLTHLQHQSTHPSMLGSEASLSKAQTKRILAICHGMCRAPFMQAAVQQGRRAWMISLGGTLGSQHPDLIATIRASSYGSWTAFALHHQRKLQMPPEEQSGEHRSSSMVQQDQSDQRVAVPNDDENLAVGYLIGTESGLPPFWTTAPPHPIVLAAVQANSDGLDVKELKLQLDELFAHAGRTIKTFRLSQYLQGFPEHFRCEGDSAHSLRVISQVSAHELMQQPGEPTLNEFPPLLPPLSDSSPLQRDDTPPSEPPTSAPAPDYDNTRTAAQVASDAESLAASNLQLRTRVHDLEAQLEVMHAKEEMHLCHICMDAPQDIVLMPCLHATFCSTCIEGGAPTSGGDTPMYNISHCPTCRSSIHGVLKLRLGM